MRIDQPDGERVMAAVQGGFLSVTGERVSILAETAQLADEIDVEQARADAAADDEAVRNRGVSQLRATEQSVTKRGLGGRAGRERPWGSPDTSGWS